MIMTQTERLKTAQTSAQHAVNLLAELNAQNDTMNARKIHRAQEHLRSATSAIQYAERQAVGVEMPKLER